MKAMHHNRLRVFISSTMTELRDVREIVGEALKKKAIEPWIYETDAGARPGSVTETSFQEVEAADIYVGIFWKDYGQVTIDEYSHARKLDKPCLIYIREKNCKRDEALENFLSTEVYDLDKGVTYCYFESAVELGNTVADDIMTWLVRRHRELSAVIKEARVSQDEIRRLQQVMHRLQNSSQDPLPEGTSLDFLAQQLRGWFKALDYRFENYNRHTPRYFEWIIHIPGRRGYVRIIIRGVGGELEIGDIRSLREKMGNRGYDEGWLIAPIRVSQGARKEAEKSENRCIFCYTFDELLDEHANFTNYFKWLQSEVKGRSIDTDYIPLSCKKEEFDADMKGMLGVSRYDDSNMGLDGYIDRWLDDPGKEHISILGEFGTGKTWFSHHYAWKMMKHYQEAKKKGTQRPRLPLVIQLRDFAKALDSESLFSDFFFRKHEIPLPGYSAFERLNRMGRLLLIFDGFDEMADKLDKQKMVNNFWELARVVVPGAKAILTCRTEHFPEAKMGRALLNAELQASTSRLVGEPPQFEILELEKFNDDQIRQVLSRKTRPEIIDRIMNHPELHDLASRPVMLEFILEALADIEAKKPVDLSRIYLYALKHKLDRDIRAQRTFTSMADKIYFMCEVSWEMLITDKMSLNYRLFPERLKNLFGAVIAEERDLDHWHYDMMGNTLLIRNEDGDYTPAHRSLLEFFASFRLAARFGVLPEDYLEVVRSQSMVDVQADAKDYTWESYFTRECDDSGIPICIRPLARFSADDLDEALAELSTMGEAVHRFVFEITRVDETREPFLCQLATIITAFVDGNRDPEDEQEILSPLLRFRQRSQEWEAQQRQEDDRPVYQFWQQELKEEVQKSDKPIVIEKIEVAVPESTLIQFSLAKIPFGTFLMGDDGFGPIHRVDITRPFHLGVVPITQNVYKAIVGKNPSEFSGDNHPVDKVSWLDAVRFCNRLSEILNIPAAYVIEGDRVEWNRDRTGFRLPTEAEWEYACRAGTTITFYTGDLESNLEACGWYERNSQGQTNPVGQKVANPWGLYDMHGNVWEWTWDWYGEYASKQTSDPCGPKRGDLRVMRGGSWNFDARNCRSASRSFWTPDFRINYVGFRLARSVGTLDA